MSCISIDLLLLACENCKILEDKLAESQKWVIVMHKLIEKHGLLDELQEMKAEEDNEEAEAEAEEEEENAPPCPSTEADDKVTNNRVNAIFEKADPHTARELILDNKTDMNMVELKQSLQNILCYRYLEKLSLKNVRLEDSHIKYLHNKLYKSCPNIKILNLSYNNLTDPTGLFVMIKHLKELEELDISNNKLGYGSAERLAKVLPNLEKLKFLYVQKNDFSVTSAWPIVNALKKKKSVSVFLMGPDNIGKTDCRILQESLQNTRSWDNLHIG